MNDLSPIFRAFGLVPESYKVVRIGSGHINHTFKLEGEKSFILQKINTQVFRQPEYIAHNLATIGSYLKEHFPDYLFLSSIPGIKGENLIYDDDAKPWRLYPYMENTITIDQVNDADQAFSAASEFGKLTRLLDQLNPARLKETIPQFHDLTLRFHQFEEAVRRALPDRLERAQQTVSGLRDHVDLVHQYEQMIAQGSMKLRVTHNDTKINNILFDATTHKAVCVIDLDTLMPGYFCYDLGDMIRTFVSPVSEEESNLDLIAFRSDMWEALVQGYLSHMGEILTASELSALDFSGNMMTYIMALRFLADYLQGDGYYHTTYPDQNLVRANNQLRLLQLLREKNAL